MVFNKQKKQFNKLVEKSRDLDEQYPRKLRKYWISFVLGMALVNILSPIVTLLVLIPLIIIIIPVLILLSLSGGIKTKSPDEAMTNMDGEYHLTDSEKIELMQNFDLIANGRTLLGKITGLIIFVPFFIAPLTQNIVESLSISFPMLSDVNFDLSFVNFNLLYWIRSILNIIQFMVAFYLTRRVRNKIKNRIISMIGRNNSGYSSKYILKINKLCNNKKYC